MKILRLTAENVKKLKVVDITANAGMNQITGKNGSGKTSVLDSIWWALGGKDGIQAVPIRKGQEKAFIRLDLGELIVERRFNASGTTTISVKNSEGAAYPSPQSMLDALVGSLSFDPLAFFGKKPREQYEDLKAIAKLPIDIDAIEKQNKADFEARTDLNRDAKARRAQAAGIAVPEGLPDQPVDESALLSQIQSASEHNAGIESSKAVRERVQRDANEKKAAAARHREIAAMNRERTAKRIADLKKQIESAEREGEAMAASADDEATTELKAAAELERKIDAAPPLSAPVDISALRADIETARVVNAGIGKKEARAGIIAEAKSLEARADELTRRMEAREREKLEALRTSAMPLPDLSLTAGGVIYKGLPFDQASDAEGLRVSVAIAMAANPTLRVIRIRDGSLLDDDGIKMVADMAAEKDYQIWLERVDSSGKVGIVLEDGSVVADNQEAAQ